MAYGTLYISANTNVQYSININTHLHIMPKYTLTMHSIFLTRV